MPKSAVIQSERGQRAVVAAFMLLLLGLSALLAYGAAYRPPTVVEAAGLRMALPAGWLAEGKQQGGRVIFRSERRSALELQVLALTPMAEGPYPALEKVLRGVFAPLTGAALPTEAEVTEEAMGGLSLAEGAGVSQQRLPLRRRPVLGLMAFAVVTDGQGQYWAMILRDQKYPHEDLRERSVAHKAQFEAVLGTLGRAVPLAQGGL